jgi:8-oxo-dGTP pyrophosphatase MutT (NUDIX family)
MSSKNKSSTERWTICDRGHVHWGAHGAAGLLFRYVPPEGEPSYLLQQRSRWVDFGGTWGIPGGAIREGESPGVAARREAEEEIGALPPYRVTEVEVQDCGAGWKFHIVNADVDHPFAAYCVQQTEATGWYTREEMRSLSLHPGFRKWFSYALENGDT